jgi:hypothetical protein
VYRLLAILGCRRYKACPCRLVGVGCVVNRALRLYRVAFWRCIGRLGLFFYETDTPPRVYPCIYVIIACTRETSSMPSILEPYYLLIVAMLVHSCYQLLIDCFYMQLQVWSSISKSCLNLGTPSQMSGYEVTPSEP